MSSSKAESKLLPLAAALILAACSSTPLTPPAEPATPAAPATSPVSTAKPVVPASQVATVTVPAYLDPNNLISKERSVYFDFDVFVVKSDYNALVERQGKYLAGNPKLAVKVEGNADERGGSEYNLALGQKRANAVVLALKVFGVKDGQMEAVSWGKEHPKALGHDEAAWAENRRADIVYPKQ